MLNFVKKLLFVLIILIILIFILRLYNGSRTEKLEEVKQESYMNPIYEEINRQDHSISNIPGVTVEKVKGDYINGYHLIPDNITKEGVVITFGGSEGSSNIYTGGKLAKEGYEVYSMYFFGQENQKKELVNVPLEFFEEVLREVTENSSSPRPLTLIGASKGAELSLLLASKYPDDIDNIVLYAPSAYVFQGLPDDMREIASSWSYKGEEIPYLKFMDSGFLSFSRMMFNSLTNNNIVLEPLYTNVVKRAKNLEEATINLNSVRANALIFAGRQDKMWNSYEMGKVIDENHPGSSELVVYENAGHLFFGPPVIDNLALGGDYQANVQAGIDSDQKLLETLDRWTQTK